MTPSRPPSSHLAEDLDRWLRRAGSECLPESILANGARVGPYRVLGLLGRGGNAEVYRATSADGAIVALKVPRRRGDVASVERFRREASFLADHPHPALPRLIGSGDLEGLPWLAIEELFPAELPSTPADVGRFLLGLCEGLAHLHSLGMVHRDLKPGNILCRADGTPVLIDLGLLKEAARTLPFPAATAPLSVEDGRAVGHGTPGWAAPEQFSGGDISPAADVYALGMLALACFDGRPPLLWRPLLRRATSPIPTDRPRDARAFAAALRRRRRIAWVGIALAVIVAALSASALISHGDRRKPPATVSRWEADPGTAASAAADGNRAAYRRVMGFPLRLPLALVPEAIRASMPEGRTHFQHLAPKLASRLGLPSDEWLTSSDYPWEIDLDLDGAVRSGGSTGISVSTLSMPVEGPVDVALRYRRHFAGNAVLRDDRRPRSFFAILDDDKAVFLDDEGDTGGNGPLGEEKTAEFSLPPGRHRIGFVYRHGGSGFIDHFNGVRIVSLSIRPGGNSQGQGGD